MRIALVTRRYPPLIGGAEKVLSYLARALVDEGASVTVLTSQVPDRPAAVEEVGGLRVVRLATSRRRFLGTLLYTMNLRSWLSRNAIDIAYVSMLKHDAFVALEVACRRGFPVVLRPEGAGATGDLAWQKWGTLGGTIGDRCKSADAVVAISPAIRAELLEAGYRPERIHDLPNGVPVPEPPWEPHARSKAVFVGRLAPEKAIQDLIDAWPIVLASRPEATLTIVGEGPERQKLEQRVTRLGVSASVSLPGMVGEVTPTLREHDLFVLPSREEGMSIALLEAMALGMPLAATAIPGNQGLVRDGVEGRLFSPGDPAALATALLSQWDDPSRAVVMGHEARRRVIAEFSIAAVARRHLELFARLT